MRRAIPCPPFSLFSESVETSLKMSGRVLLVFTFDKQASERTTTSVCCLYYIPGYFHYSEDRKLHYQDMQKTKDFLNSHGGSVMECEDGVWLVLGDKTIEVNQTEKPKGRDFDEDDYGLGEDTRFWYSFMAITLTVVAVMVCAIGWTLTQDMEGSVLFDEETEEDNSLIPMHDASEMTSTSRRPPLSSLVTEEQTDVIGNVQFLMDFAIVGHAKCSTTFHQQWIGDHDEVQMYKHVCTVLHKLGEEVHERSFHIAALTSYLLFPTFS